MKHKRYRIKTFEYNLEKPLIVQDFQSEESAASFYFSNENSSLYPSISVIELSRLTKKRGKVEEIVIKTRINPKFDPNWDKNLNVCYALNKEIIEIREIICGGSEQNSLPHNLLMVA